MSIRGDIAWQRNTTSYDAILDNVRNKNSSNASIEDLSMFNQQCAEDPLESLLRMEELDDWSALDYTTGGSDMSTQLKKAMNDAGVEAKNTEVEQVITEKLHEMLDEMTQFTFERMVTGGYWVASLLHESADGRPDNFVPDIDDTECGIAQAIEGIELYAYNRDTQDRDPARKGMSTGQWEFLNNMAKQAVESYHRLNTLQEANFIVQTSFEEKFEEVRNAAQERARNKQLEANMREARRKDKTTQAAKEVRGKLALVTGR